jgi:CRP-like cAMP-binding protein
MYNAFGNESPNAGQVMASAGLELLLGQSALLRGLPDQEVKTIIQAGHKRGVARDEFFFQQGDPARTLFILTSGQARLVQVTPEGNQIVMRYIAVGEMFGGIAFLGETVYPASAQAIAESAALSWDGETMAGLMERYPQLALNALGHMAGRIQELQDRLREMATERVERRIANTLLRLARQTGKKTAEGVLIDLPLSRQDLAEMSGTTLYTVSRTLSRWEQQGIVEAGRERVLIRVPHRLVMIAQDLPPPDAKPIA